MRFYTENRDCYCGIDLHTKQMYACILNSQGEIVRHENLPAKPRPFLAQIAEFRDGLAVGVECILSWYWLADLCESEGIGFLLGHALYMKAIHGGKSKNDKLDSEKIARLMRGGTFPLAYAYPAELRPYRDLRSYYQLQSVPGIGQILALVILHEVGDLSRFPTVQSFCSCARLVKCPKESAGKLYGCGGGKIGNAHLKWAFSEATALFLRESQRAKAFVAKLEKKHGKGKAMSILAHKLGRAVYFMWKRQDAFDEKYFFKV